MRHKWISPFGLYGSLMRRNNQQAKPGNPEESDKRERRLGRAAVGNGSGDPLLIATETLIKEEPKSEFEEQTQERKGYGDKWLNGDVNPQYGMSRRSKIRKARIDVWLEEEMEED